MKSFKTILHKYRQAGATILVLLALVLAAGAAHHFIHQNTPSKSAQLQKITSQVGKLMILPANETPTLATVTDAGKLANNPIFNGSQDGDRVLIYTKSQQLIIYRPSINKIVNIRPLITDKKGSPYVTSTIAILNGSGNNDLLSKMTRTVVSDFPNATIVQKDAAPRDFPNSIVIDLTKKDQPLDEQIADTLGIKSGQLPLGINPDSADFLVIIGQDYK